MKLDLTPEVYHREREAEEIRTLTEALQAIAEMTAEGVMVIGERAVSLVDLATAAEKAAKRCWRDDVEDITPQMVGQWAQAVAIDLGMEVQAAERVQERMTAWGGPDDLFRRNDVEPGEVDAYMRRESGLDEK